MAQAIIDSSYANPAPRRLILGSDAYVAIREALTDRIAALDAQRAIALSTDAEDELQVAPNALHEEADHA